MYLFLFIPFWLKTRETVSIIIQNVFSVFFDPDNYLERF